MGCRGRPSLKISSEARLERRRAQLAESQRKCRARKRMSKTGEQNGFAATSPCLEAVLAEPAFLDTDNLEMEANSGVDSLLKSPPLTDTARKGVAVSGVAPT